MSKIRKDVQTVLTNKGIIDITDVNVGDIVYGAEDGKPIEVVHRRDIPSESYLEIEYTCGMRHICRDREMLTVAFYRDPCGNKVVGSTHVPMSSLNDPSRPIDVYNDTNIDVTKYEQFKSTGSTLKIHPSIDPYVAGAFLMYGNPEIPFMNLPIDCAYKRMAVFIYTKFGWSSSIINNNMAIIFHMSYHDEPITWESYFPDSNQLTMNRGSSTLSDIMDRYLFEEYIVRMKLIRSIVDIGCINVDENYGSFNIMASDNDRTKSFQRLLLSVGIISKVIDGRIHIMNADVQDISYDEYILREYSTKFKSNHYIRSITVRDMNYYPYSGTSVHLLPATSDDFCFLSGDLIPIPFG